MLQTSGRLRTPPPPSNPEVAALVRAAAAGDGSAVGHLVDRFDRVLRGIAGSYRLSPWDVDDVVQATWLQFLRHAGTLREPAAVGGWLATTARRESLRLLQRHVREYVTPEPDLDARCDRAEPDRELLAAERRELVRHALGELPDRQRDLMRMLVAQPDLSYEEVGRRLDMPIGSIGPTRARSLARLRGSSGLRALQAASN